MYLLQDIFAFADQQEQSILVFDDLDVLVPKPSIISSMLQIRLSSYFLSEIHRRNLIASSTVIIGIVSQNQLASLDYTVCCTGYIEHMLTIPRLNRQRRLSILQHFLPNADNIEELADNTASYSIADLLGLCSSIVIKPSEPVKIQIASSLRQFRRVNPLVGGLSNVFGMSKIISRIKNSIIRPILNPTLYSRYDLQPPSGALFYGPSGTGKSFMIRALAGEYLNRIHVIEVNCSDILGKVSFRRLRDE